MIAGEMEIPEKREKPEAEKAPKQEKRKFDLVIDIQEKWHRERMADMCAGRKI